MYFNDGKARLEKEAQIAWKDLKEVISTIPAERYYTFSDEYGFSISSEPMYDGQITRIEAVVPRNPQPFYVRN